MSDLQNIVTEYNAVREKFKNEVVAKLKNAFGKFFDEYPQFRSIEWVQYTPYFADGDECVFSVNEFFYTAQKEFYANGGEWLGDDYSIWDLDDNMPFAGVTPHQRASSYHREKVEAFDALSDEVKAQYADLQSAWKTLSKALRSIPDEVFRDAFDDHSRVKVTKDGIEVARYEHD